MPIRFLADANLDQDIVTGVLRRHPEIDFELPQGVIPDRMPDPEVLSLAASHGSRARNARRSHDAGTLRRVIRYNRSPGLILIPASMPIGQAIEHLSLIWEISEPEEWTNRFRRLSVLCE
ncbi:MAG: hypothetical protein ABI824_15050 [Acidobacteriota bacterium]